jgi:starch synthase (maltosyl-transferring)
MSPEKDGRRRVVVEGLTPQVDCGRFPVKRVVGDQVEVRADVFADGHDAVAAVVRYKHERERRWREARMRPLGNDRFAGTFSVERLGCYRYGVAGWVDRFGAWRDQLERRVAAGQDVGSELADGARLVGEAAAAAGDRVAEELGGWDARLRGDDRGDAVDAALSPDLRKLMEAHDPRPHAVESADVVTISVDPPLARCGAWYELFPRSLGGAGRHGTLADVEAALPRVADMGFDVLYLPPVHPIGTTKRKGPNNEPEHGPDDPGSPWAIGAAAGGHTAVHPELGDVADVRRLAAACAERGIALALDLAFQCSPDHPWVSEHPEWFRHRPDDTIRYAENPPKRYEDIYPLDFECEAWEALWDALLGVVRFWIDQGVAVFRVDNPHTKPFVFWEWLIAEVKRDRPDVIFLAEAFTRPRVMERLAKLGFSQSYTYFAWRHTKHELQEYVNELTETGVAEYFRPNFWPNTPDILTEAMQSGGSPTFAARLVLAATLSASYGVYGPAFELVERRGLRPGSEEYLDSEKYQLRAWDLEDPGSLEPLVRAVNAARHAHPALQANERLWFHGIDNDALVAFTKHTADLADLVLVIVSLDPHYVQSGWLDLPLADLGIDREHPFQVHDLLDGETYVWQGPRSYVELDPGRTPAHLFHIRRRLRSEEDFEYFA